MNFNQIKTRQALRTLMNGFGWLFACGVALGLQSCKLYVYTWHSKPKAKQESEWNVAGVWQRVSDDPPTYRPTGYEGALSTEHGGWLTNIHNRNRFFVPNTPVDGIPPEVLKNDALKNSF